MVGYNQQYKQLVERVLKEGTTTKCRNGKQVIIPSATLLIDASDWKLKLRKMNYLGVYGEWLTFIDKQPLTNVKQFRDNNCQYWNMFADEDGYIRLDYHDKLQEQIWDIIDQIKRDPGSRRHVIDLWDHNNVKNDVLSLPCCHYSYIFSVIDGKIHLTWNQRSADVMLGVPSDIYLGNLLLNFVSSLAGYKTGTMTFNFSNVHIYADHIENAKELLTRTEEDFDKPLKFKLL